MTVAGMGMATSSVLSCVWVSVARAREPACPPLPINSATWVRGCLPVGLFMAATLWAGNLVRRLEAMVAAPAAHTFMCGCLLVVAFGACQYYLVLWQLLVILRVLT